jgi:hypothetical protein
LIILALVTLPLTLIAAIAANDLDLDNDLFWASFLACVVVTALAVIASFTFGGSRRNAAAQLATGAYALATGVIIMATASASARALQDNAYLSNAFVGLLFQLLGLALLTIALGGLWRARVDRGIARGAWVGRMVEHPSAD